jgi:sulfite exporter TauE/SafE
MGRWLAKPYGGIVAGTLHGLIPCGMVYLAIAGSLNTASAIPGARFMLLFGLGTTPLLFLASLAPLAFRKIGVPKLMVPILFFVSGALLLSRGLNLDIPYISMPVMADDEISVCK